MLCRSMSAALRNRGYLSASCAVSPLCFYHCPEQVFPVEHHTALLLADYQPHIFTMACRLTGQDDWANDET